MGFLSDKCSVFSHTDEMLKQSKPFSCGDKDLDEFFMHDAVKYERQLLGKSYSFRLDSDNSIIVCMFTLSNSSIDARNLPNNRRRKLTENIPHEKSLSTYPATLIGRLGVDKNFSGKGVGLELIKYIKQRMLLLSNIAACRYLTVDAYSNESALKFYEANGFKPLFSSDKQEKEYIGLPIDKELKTRLLYFDLIKLNNIKMDFIKVYGTGKLYEAELIVGLLSNNNIEATVINKRDSQYLFGEAEVHVAAADAEMAKEIISNRHE